jgi:hypothetical protein
MIVWTIFAPGVDLGFLPDMLSERNPARAREQLHHGYAHGGGWDPFKGHELLADNSLKYPGDPSLPPLAQTKLRDELIILYQHSWVAIIQPDRSYEICRMD